MASKPCYDLVLCMGIGGGRLGPTMPEEAPVATTVLTMLAMLLDEQLEGQQKDVVTEEAVAGQSKT